MVIITIMQSLIMEFYAFVFTIIETEFFMLMMFHTELKVNFQSPIKLQILTNKSFAKLDMKI